MVAPCVRTITEKSSTVGGIQTPLGHEAFFSLHQYVTSTYWPDLIVVSQQYVNLINRTTNVLRYTKQHINYQFQKLTPFDHWTV